MTVTDCSNLGTGIVYRSLSVYTFSNFRAVSVDKEYARFEFRGDKNQAG